METRISEILRNKVIQIKIYSLIFFEQKSIFLIVFNFKIDHVD